MVIDDSVDHQKMIFT